MHLHVLHCKEARSVPEIFLSGLLGRVALYLMATTLLQELCVKEVCARMHRAMQDECNALELELKHHEEEFADLVSEELEQRFTRFEEVTLSAVQKLVGIISSPAGAPGSFATRLVQNACLSRMLWKCSDSPSKGMCFISRSLKYLH